VKISATDNQIIKGDIDRVTGSQASSGTKEAISGTNSNTTVAGHTDDPNSTIPMPRYNAMLAILRNTLYMYDLYFLL
jgi:hypothetical protein